jgi:hypothetical protein
VKRWIVIAALGLAAVGGMVTPGTARANSTAWYQVYQSGFTGVFNPVVAISKSNIWAVADTYTAKGQTVYTPFIRHFNGSSWQAITIPGANTSTSEWVSASASNNVWVGGFSDKPNTNDAVYRWNGAHWGQVPVPSLTDLQDVAVLAPNNVWAIGSSATIYDDVFHWNGTKWMGYISNLTNFIPQGISAIAANNVWVSGYAWSGSKMVAVAYQWNGSAWHAVSMPHPVLSAGAFVTVLSPSNVWVGYDTNTASRVLHWDGHLWHTVTIPSYALEDVLPVPDGKGGYWFGPQAILTGSTWTSVQVPGFTGGIGGVTRILGTTSFLMNAGVETGSSSTEKPTIFRFDL